MPLGPRTARVDDFESLAKDSNRRLNTKFDLPAQPGPALTAAHRPVGTQTLTNAPTQDPNQVLTGLPITPDKSQVETLDTIAKRFATGGVPQEQNLARGHFAPGTELGVDALAAGPQAAFNPPAAPAAVAPVTDIPDPTGVSDPTATPAPAAAPTAAAPGGFTLNDLLTAVGPAKTGFGSLALLGLGSSVVAQNEAQIGARFGREQDIAEARRAEETTAADIAYKQSLGEQAGATAENTRFTTRQARLGIPTGKTSPFRTTIIPADPIAGTEAQIARTHQGTGAVEVAPATTGFDSAVAAQNAAGSERVFAAIDAFKQANPAFKDADDESVAAEILKRQQAGGS